MYYSGLATSNTVGCGRIGAISSIRQSYMLLSACGHQFEVSPRGHTPSILHATSRLILLNLSCHQQLLFISLVLDRLTHTTPGQTPSLPWVEFDFFLIVRVMSPNYKGFTDQYYRRHQRGHRVFQVACPHPRFRHPINAPKPGGLGCRDYAQTVTSHRFDRKWSRTILTDSFDVPSPSHRPHAGLWARAFT